MRKPAVGGRAVPVHHAGADLDHVARQQFPRRFALRLIIPPTAHGDEQLPARVAVPVVPATRLERDVRNGAVQGLVTRQPRKIGLPGKILRKHFRQLLPPGKNRSVYSLLRFHVTRIVGLCVNFRRQRQRRDKRRKNSFFHPSAIYRGHTS